MLVALSGHFLGLRSLLAFRKNDKEGRGLRKRPRTKKQELETKNVPVTQ